MTVVVLAEKPSVARDIAGVLGATQRKGGWLEGGGYKVTWAIGHLVGLAQPHEIQEEWRRWDPALLPMIPDRFPLTTRDGLAEQLAVVKGLFNAAGTREIVCATDAGREGELIFRMIYEAVGCRKPVRRLWISSLTTDAITAGFAALKPSSAFDRLAAAARVRSESDWLVGMNLSRAYSLGTGERLNVGRVKTPTLAMVVARDQAIARFVPEGYREVEAKFATSVGEFVATYVRADYDGKGKPILNPRLPARGGDASTDAEQVVARARSGAASLKHVEEEQRALQPPMLFDLTELQRVANRLWGWTAQHTLNVAQELYESHKVLSYPRTDSRHLSASVAATAASIVQNVRTAYEGLLVAETGTAKLSKRFVDDGKVSDHHAIIPTGTRANLPSGSDAAQLFDLVCRRFLCAWQPDGIDATARVDVAVCAAGVEDRYTARGKAVLRPGWRALDLTGAQGDEPVALPGGLRKGMPAQVRDVQAVNKNTRPPPYFTEATLLSAMESAGAALEGELSDAMRERGLGTPATRASTIEELVAKEYIARDGKTLRAAPRGVLIIKSVHPHLASPAMTGEWEARLRRIERGEATADGLLEDVRNFVRTGVQQALANGVAPRRDVGGSREPAPRSRRGKASSGQQPRSHR